MVLVEPGRQSGKKSIFVTGKPCFVTLVIHILYVIHYNWRSSIGDYVLELEKLIKSDGYRDIRKHSNQIIH